MAEVTQTDESGESMYSFSEMVADLQKHHDERQEKTHIKAGKFIAAAMPATKLLLNVTGTVVRNAGVLGPLHIATNGLTQVLDIVMAPNVQAGDVLTGLDLSLMDQCLINQLEFLPRSEISDDILRRTLDLQTALIDFLRIGLSGYGITTFRKLAELLSGKIRFKTRNLHSKQLVTPCGSPFRTICISSTSENPWKIAPRRNLTECVLTQNIFAISQDRGSSSTSKDCLVPRRA